MISPAGGGEARSDLRKISIDKHLTARHEAAVVGGEERRGGAGLGRVAEPPDRRAGAQPFHRVRTDDVEGQLRPDGSGDSTLTRMPVPLRSSAQLRARFQTTALLAL